MSEHPQLVCEIGGGEPRLLPEAARAVVAAERACATVREPLADFVSGDRLASILDPFGVRWTIMTRVEDISEEKNARRAAE